MEADRRHGPGESEKQRKLLVVVGDSIVRSPDIEVGLESCLRRGWVVWVIVLRGRRLEGIRGQAKGAIKKRWEEERKTQKGKGTHRMELKIECIKGKNI